MVHLNLVGNSFQAAGPATEKARLPNCVFVTGTSNAPDVEERRRSRPGSVETGTSSLFVDVLGAAVVDSRMHQDT